MSLIKNLKSRPLNRDTGSLRDDKLFIVACDDTYAPKQYFDFFRLTRVQVHVVPTPNDDTRCHAIDVLNRLETFNYEEDDERWILLDTDRFVSGSQIKQFKRIIKEAKEKGIFVALSKPCFELWLLLHHVDKKNVGELNNAKEVGQALSGFLGGYNKTRLKREHFPLDTVAKAYLQAKDLDKSVKGGVIPLANTSRVYQLWDSIITSALPSQLPSELAVLLASKR